MRMQSVAVGDGMLTSPLQHADAEGIISISAFPSWRGMWLAQRSGVPVGRGLDGLSGGLSGRARSEAEGAGSAC